MPFLSHLSLAVVSRDLALTEGGAAGPWSPGWSPCADTERHEQMECSGGHFVFGAAGKAGSPCSTPHPETLAPLPIPDTWASGLC